MALLMGISASSPAQEASGLAAKPGARIPRTKHSVNPLRPPSDEDTSDPQNTIGRPLLKHFAQDQIALWTAPARLRAADAPLLVSFGGLTAALLASDREFSRHLSNSKRRINRSRSFSNNGVAALVGAAGGLYLWGKFTADEHKRETGLLAGEAFADALAASAFIEYSSGRVRPTEGNGSGRFFSGGKSFPSNHAIAAWSIAGVIAHEYPGPLTKLAAYGLASAVSAARVTGKDHFPADVFVSSGIGLFTAWQVYRLHHNPGIGGGSWESFPGAADRESPLEPRSMSSPYVPLDSWIYPAFDRLAAFGIVPTAMAGMRPWTRLECARLLAEAGGSPGNEDFDSPEAARLYQALSREFEGELEGRGGARNRQLRLESVYTRFREISGPPLRDGFHFGQTLINDYGRPFAEGANNVSGLSGWATEGPFAVYLRGEYQHAGSSPPLSDAAKTFIARADGIPGSVPGTGAPATNRFRLLEGYVAMKFASWQVSFGKQSVWWGPGDGGPMMLSDNAEPITMLRISRVSPFKLPGIFGRLGPMRTEFFLGHLGGYEFMFNPSGFVGQFGRSLAQQPFIHGQKISFKPTPNLEIGVSRTTLFSGAGYPFTWNIFLRSLFSTGNTGAGNPKKPGDRRSGMDFSYRIPGLRRWLTFYGDGFTEDQFSPFGYPDRSVWRGGLFLPQIPRLPRLDFRVEGVYTDSPLGGHLGHGFWYMDGTYRSGYRNLGNLLGSWIGRQGQGAQAWTTYWLTPQSKIQLSYRHQKVSQEFLPGGGTLNDASIQADWWVRSNFSVSSFVQYELWKFPVVAPGTHHNVTSSFEFTYRPRAWFPKNRAPADAN